MTINPITNANVANASPAVLARFTSFVFLVIKLSGNRFASIGHRFIPLRASEREVAINSIEKLLGVFRLIVSGGCNLKTWTPDTDSNFEVRCSAKYPPPEIKIVSTDLESSMLLHDDKAFLISSINIGVSFSDMF